MFYEWNVIEKVVSCMFCRRLQQFKSRFIILYGLFDFGQSVLLLFRLTFDVIFYFCRFVLVNILNKDFVFDKL